MALDEHKISGGPLKEIDWANVKENKKAAHGQDDIKPGCANWKGTKFTPRCRYESSKLQEPTS